MAIDRNSNAYTITFSVIMVLVVGAILSYVSLSLKPLQVQNAIKKEMMSILGSVGIESERSDAEDDFYKYITKRIVLNSKGEVVETREGKIDVDDLKEPFNVDVKKEFRDSKLKADDKQYPLYIANINGEEIAVIPMVGKGLWGPIWGYVALKSDFSTVYGATFDHQGETPGLGAEIRGKSFQSEFAGKEIYNDNGELVSITVAGTITSKGVQEMLKRTFSVYDSYFEKNKTQTSQL